MPVDVPELEVAQRQLTVGALLAAVDEVVHRAVHRLEAVGHAVDVEGVEHPFAVVRQVPRGVEEPLLGDVRGPDVLEALLDVALADVVLHDALDDAALGVEDGQPRADLVGEGVEVELAPELAVVATLGLGEPVEVGLELVLRRPGGAVDALELRVLLRAAPVGGGAAHDLVRVAEDLGARDVRAAAQVAPGDGAVAADVVVDRQLGAADLDRGTFGCVFRRAALETDELALVRLVRQLFERVGVVDLAADEGLPLVDDPLHGLLEGLEVLGGEGLCDVEVVVEAVADRRTDAELGPGVGLLDGLGEDVRGAVPQDVEAVLLLRGHRLDDVAVGDDVREVAQLAVDPGDKDRLVVTEEVGRGSALVHRSLAPGGGDADLGGHAVLLDGRRGVRPVGRDLLTLSAEPGPAHPEARQSARGSGGAPSSPSGRLPAGRASSGRDSSMSRTMRIASTSIAP